MILDIVLRKPIKVVLFFPRDNADILQHQAPKILFNSVACSRVVHISPNFD